MLRTHVVVGDWRDLLPHPIADLFPLLLGEELRALERDIRENGFDGHRPIVIFEGKILDGRNRHRACLVQDNEADPLTKPEFVRYEQAVSDPSPLDWVVSVNLNRRHLTESQRAMVAAKIANMRQGERTDLPQICERSVSQTEAARMLNVSPRSVSTARAIQEADPELAEEVKVGNRSLNSAVLAVKRERNPANPEPPKLIVITNAQPGMSAWSGQSDGIDMPRLVPQQTEPPDLDKAVDSLFYCYTPEQIRDFIGLIQKRLAEGAEAQGEVDRAMAPSSPPVVALNIPSDGPQEQPPAAVRTCRKCRAELPADKRDALCRGCRAVKNRRCREQRAAKLAAVSCPKEPNRGVAVGSDEDLEMAVPAAQS